MICITFDTDYMTDSSMPQFLERYSLPGNCTFFLTDPYAAIDWKNHETCPHPFLGIPSSEWMKATQSLRSSIPKVGSGVRSHSCVFSQPFALELAQNGFEYSSVTTPVFEKSLRPYRLSWGIWEMPIFYMDNMDFCFSENWPTVHHQTFDKQWIQMAVNDPEGLYVFDFHPLHIALNTPNFLHYQTLKDQIIRKKKNPFDLRAKDRGVETYFIELCEEMESRGLKSVTLSQALAHHKGKKVGESL